MNLSFSLEALCSFPYVLVGFGHLHLIVNVTTHYDITLLQGSDISLNNNNNNNNNSLLNSFAVHTELTSYI